MTTAAEAPQDGTPSPAEGASPGAPLDEEEDLVFAWELLLHREDSSPGLLTLKQAETKLQKYLRSHPGIADEANVEAPAAEEEAVVLNYGQALGHSVLSPERLQSLVQHTEDTVARRPDTPRDGEVVATAGVFRAVGKLWAAAKRRRRRRQRMEVDSAVSSSKVATVVTPETKDSIPYNLQGGMKWYTDDKMEQRESLRRAVLVELALDKWWLCAEKDPKLGGVTEAVYKALCRKMCAAIFPVRLSEKDMQRMLQEDWAKDSQGKPVLDSTTFLDAIFNFADVWCETDNLFEYVKFIDTFFAICFPEKEAQFPPINLKQHIEYRSDWDRLRPLDPPELYPVDLDSPKPSPPPEDNGRALSWTRKAGGAGSPVAPPPNELRKLWAPAQRHASPRAVHGVSLSPVTREPPKADAEDEEDEEEEEEEEEEDDPEQRLLAWNTYMTKAAQQYFRRKEVERMIKRHVRTILNARERNAVTIDHTLVFREAMRGLVPEEQLDLLTLKLDGEVHRVVKKTLRKKRKQLIAQEAAVAEGDEMTLPGGVGVLQRQYSLSAFGRLLKPDIPKANYDETGAPAYECEVYVPLRVTLPTPNTSSRRRRRRPEKRASGDEADKEEEGEEEPSPPSARDGKTITAGSKVLLFRNMAADTAGGEQRNSNSRQPASLGSLDFPLPDWPLPPGMPGMGGFPFHAHAKADGTPRQRRRKGGKEKSEVSDALRRPFGASLEAQFNMQFPEDLDMEALEARVMDNLKTLKKEYVDQKKWGREVSSSRMKTVATNATDEDLMGLDLDRPPEDYSSSADSLAESSEVSLKAEESEASTEPEPEPEPEPPAEPEPEPVVEVPEEEPLPPAEEETPPAEEEPPEETAPPEPVVLLARYSPVRRFRRLSGDENANDNQLTLSPLMNGMEDLDDDRPDRRRREKLEEVKEAQTGAPKLPPTRPAKAHQVLAMAPKKKAAKKPRLLPTTPRTVSSRAPSAAPEEEPEEAEDPAEAVERVMEAQRRSILEEALSEMASTVEEEKVLRRVFNAKVEAVKKQEAERQLRALRDSSKRKEKARKHWGIVRRAVVKKDDLTPNLRKLMEALNDKMSAMLLMRKMALALRKARAIFGTDAIMCNKSTVFNAFAGWDMEEPTPKTPFQQLPVFRKHAAREMGKQMQQLAGVVNGLAAAMGPGQPDALLAREALGSILTADVVESSLRFHGTSRDRTPVLNAQVVTTDGRCIPVFVTKGGLVRMIHEYHTSLATGLQLGARPALGAGLPPGPDHPSSLPTGTQHQHGFNQGSPGPARGPAMGVWDGDGQLPFTSEKSQLGGEELASPGGQLAFSYVGALPLASEDVVEDALPDLPALPYNPQLPSSVHLSQPPSKAPARGLEDCVSTWNKTLQDAAEEEAAQIAVPPKKHGKLAKASQRASDTHTPAEFTRAKEDLLRAVLQGTLQSYTAQLMQHILHRAGLQDHAAQCQNISIQFSQAPGRTGPAIAPFVISRAPFRRDMKMATVNLNDMDFVAGFNHTPEAGEPATGGRSSLRPMPKSSGDSRTSVVSLSLPTRWSQSAPGMTPRQLSETVQPSARHTRPSPRAEEAREEPDGNASTDSDASGSGTEPGGHRPELPDIYAFSPRNRPQYHGGPSSPLPRRPPALAPVPRRTLRQSPTTSPTLPTGAAAPEGLSAWTGPGGDDGDGPIPAEGVTLSQSPRPRLAALDAPGRPPRCRPAPEDGLGPGSDGGNSPLSGSPKGSPLSPKVLDLSLHAMGPPPPARDGSELQRQVLKVLDTLPPKKAPETLPPQTSLNMVTLQLPSTPADGFRRAMPRVAKPPTAFPLLRPPLGGPSPVPRPRPLLPTPGPRRRPAPSPAKAPAPAAPDHRNGHPQSNSSEAPHPAGSPLAEREDTAPRAPSQQSKPAGAANPAQAWASFEPRQEVFSPPTHLSGTSAPEHPRPPEVERATAGDAGDAEALPRMKGRPLLASGRTPPGDSPAAGAPTKPIHALPRVESFRAAVPPSPARRPGQGGRATPLEHALTLPALTGKLH